MIAFSFFLLSRIRVSICAFVLSSTIPWFYYLCFSLRSIKYRNFPYLMSVRQLLQGLVYTLLQNSDLLILLVADTINLSLCVIKLSEKIVNLLLLNLHK